MHGNEMSALRRALESVHERIAAAALRSGRNAADVTLVAITKTQPAELIRAACELGLRDFGENRLEEAGFRILSNKEAGPYSYLIVSAPEEG